MTNFFFDQDVDDHYEDFYWCGLQRAISPEEKALLDETMPAELRVPVGINPIEQLIDEDTKEPVYDDEFIGFADKLLIAFSIAILSIVAALIIFAVYSVGGRI